MSSDLEKLNEYVNKVFKDRDVTPFTNFYNKTIENRYGKIINVFILFLMRFTARCFDTTEEGLMSDKQKKFMDIFLKWKSKRGVSGGILGGILGAIVGADTGSKDFEIKTGLGALAGAAIGATIASNTEKNFSEFFGSMYMAFVEYFLSISKNIGVNDMRQENYLSRNTPVVTDIEAIQHLYYWCYYACIVYEEESHILSLLPRIEETSAQISKYFRYYNKFSHTVSKPIFFIYVDHLSQSIVIAIRGTASVADVIADALGDMKKFDCKFTRFTDNPDYLAHGGFFDGACDVLGQVREKLDEFVSIWPNYHVKVVGHSYGAGITSIVTWALEQDRQNGSLKTNVPVRGIAICCPPVFNEPAVRETCGLIATVILGWDCVPCASANNCFKLSCNSENSTEKCYNSKDLFDISLYCESYVPGTIYWLTYDDVTREVQNLNLITFNNDRLKNIMIHEHMDDDHSSQKVYMYLLALINKKSGQR
jgi:hypothetical protein